VVGDRVEAAYRRGDAIEKRRALMADWADYCIQPTERALEVAASVRHIPGHGETQLTTEATAK